MTRRAHAWLLPLLLGAACAGEPEAAAPAADPAPALLPALPSDGVRAALVAEPDGSFALRLDIQGEAIGSVQGELTFDPAVLAVSQVAPVTGAFTAVNLDELATGRVRFATFSSGALASGRLLDLQAEPRGPVSRAAVRVYLEAAGSLDARSLDQSRLHGTEGVYRVAP